MGFRDFTIYFKGSHWLKLRAAIGRFGTSTYGLIELELIQSHMAQKPVLWGEVGCACVAREVSVETTTTTTALKHPANALEAAPRRGLLLPFLPRGLRASIPEVRRHGLGERVRVLVGPARVAPSRSASGLKPGVVHMEQRRLARCARAGQTKQPQERAPPPRSQGGRGGASARRQR